MKRSCGPSNCPTMACSVGHEHLTFNQRVVGSIPTALTKQNKHLQGKRQPSSRGMFCLGEGRGKRIFLAAALAWAWRRLDSTLSGHNGPPGLGRLSWAEYRATNAIAAGRRRGWQ